MGTFILRVHTSIITHWRESRCARAPKYLDGVHHTMFQSGVNSVFQRQHIQPPFCGYSDVTLTASILAKYIDRRTSFNGSQLAKMKKSIPDMPLP